MNTLHENVRYTLHVPCTVIRKFGSIKVYILIMEHGVIKKVHYIVRSWIFTQHPEIFLASIYCHYRDNSVYYTHLGRRAWLVVILFSFFFPPHRSYGAGVINTRDNLEDHLVTRRVHIVHL